MKVRAERGLALDVKFRHFWLHSLDARSYSRLLYTELTGLHPQRTLDLEFQERRLVSKITEMRYPGLFISVLGSQGITPDIYGGHWAEVLTWLTYHPQNFGSIGTRVS